MCEVCVCVYYTDDCNENGYCYRRAESRAAAGFGYARGKTCTQTHVHTAHGNTRASAASRPIRVTVARRKYLKYEIPPGTRLTHSRGVTEVLVRKVGTGNRAVGGAARKKKKK